MPEFNPGGSFNGMKELYNAFTTNKVNSRAAIYAGGQQLSKSNQSFRNSHPYSMTETKPKFRKVEYLGINYIDWIFKGNI